jgi:hypothetical protein
MCLSLKELPISILWQKLKKQRDHFKMVSYSVVRGELPISKLGQKMKGNESFSKVVRGVSLG